MNLTIEKAKKIVNQQNKQLDHGRRMNTQTVSQEYLYVASNGFIEGWNQAIKKVIEEINLQPKPYTVSGIIEREELRYILNGLKVKGEK